MTGKHNQKTAHFVRGFFIFSRKFLFIKFALQSLENYGKSVYNKIK